MNAIFNILTVSKYEAKTLFRSWFFRIFSILALVFIFLFNMGTQTSVGFPSGDMVSLPSIIPFINLYIINVAQAIIAVFLASDFLKRDKKLDTTEVIYMRSMTNADYVIGKTLGNVWVFFVLNFVALGIVAVFNLASPFNSFSLLPYIYYFLIISLPTLIFILGFSFFLMSIIHNQAVTFVVLLGYIAATLFYLQNIYHYLFDYMAFHLPLTYSDFVGFASPKEIILHRGIYLCLGLGFIGLTIMILKRLPQSKIVMKSTLVSSILFLAMGFGLAFFYVWNINADEEKRKEMLALNNKYAANPLAQIKRCDLELEHKGTKINAKADIELVNANNVALKEFILTLNPGLVITELTGAKYVRELQLLKITPALPLEPGDSLKIAISYEGDIDERFCYLDSNPEKLKIVSQSENAIADKKYAFITPDYLLLTPETRWYPTSGISYSNNGLNWLSVQFTDFTLKVKTKKGLKAISQGKVTDEGDGSYRFEPETAQRQISLAIGDYETRSIKVDDIDYSLNFLKGHSAFDEYFKELPDSLAPVIRDLKKSWEAKVQFEYPFQRLNLVEIPAQFCSFDHVWNGINEQVQPEMVYLREGGYKINSANFALSKRFAERMGQFDNETLSPREKEENYFRRFVNETFLTSKNNQFRGGGGMRIRIGSRGPNIGAEEKNPYFIFPNYYDYVAYIKSVDYPISNRVFESYLSKAATETGNPFMRNIAGMSNTEQGNIALQEKSFAQILIDQNDPLIIDNVIQTKSGFLFALMKGAAGTDKFDPFIHKFIEARRFREISVDELNNEMKSSFGLDLQEYLPAWYNSKTLPGYIISKVQAVKVKEGDMIKTMVSLVLTNTENDPGAVTVSFRLGGGGRRMGGGGGPGFFMRGGGGGSEDNIEKTVSIEGRQSKKISFLLNREPRIMTVNTYASHNIPSTISQQFEKIEIDEKVTGVEGEKVIEYTEGSDPSEIILDNEDAGFILEQPQTKSLILDLLSNKGKKEEEMKYKGMNFWNPPADWTLTTSEQFYGKQIRSAYYMKGGTGNSKAIWNIPLKESGYYRLSAHIPKIRFGRGRDEERRSEEYNFLVYSDDGKDQQVVDLNEIDGGWSEIGSYHFSKGSAKVELSNLSKARTVFADAIKLVKEN